MIKPVGNKFLIEFNEQKEEVTQSGIVLAKKPMGRHYRFRN
jgi:co-chaperonin GroES (HSP10)